MKTEFSNTSRLLAAGLLLTVVVAACATKDDNDNSRKLANRLFSQSVNLANSYIDSMNASGDSATVLRLSEHYEDRVTHINFKYPPETYMHLSEDQNDTLTRLTERFVRTKREKLEKFGGKETANDSTDSTRRQMIPLRPDYVPSAGRRR